MQQVHPLTIWVTVLAVGFFGALVINIKRRKHKRSREERFNNLIGIVVSLAFALLTGVFACKWWVAYALTFLDN